MLSRLGLNWGKPSDPSLQEQYTAEIFYRFQLVGNIAFTPSIQYIKNPTANPTSIKVWVYGFRWRMTF